MCFSKRLCEISLTLSTIAFLLFASCNGGGSNTPSPQTPKEWGVAELIETLDTGSAESPQVAMDDAGNAVAVWKQYDGSKYHIWASYYNGSTWGAAEMIEHEDSDGNSNDPQVAMDGAGNAIAVWAQHGGLYYRIWVNYFNGSTWGTAEPVENGNISNARFPQIAMDDDGNAIAVWEQHDSTSHIRANYFNGDAWGTAALIESNASGNAYTPQIVMDGYGNAIAVWRRYDGFYYNIRANTFNGSTWATAETIDSNNLGDAYSPQIAVNYDGNAVTVWEQHDGFRYNVWANDFILYEDDAEVAEWGIGKAIETYSAGNAESPQIAMDDNGKAVAVWMQYDGSRYNIWANTFDGADWGTPELIEAVDTGSAYSPQIAMDNDGNAIAVWMQYDGFRYNIWANNFDDTAVWGTAELIEADDSGNADAPRIAMDDAGNAVVVWMQYDGSQFSIYSNRFE